MMANPSDDVTIPPPRIAAVSTESIDGLVHDCSNSNITCRCSLGFYAIDARQFSSLYSIPWFYVSYFNV